MISVADIEDRLRAQCEDLVRHILPAARKEGPYLKVGSIYGEAGSSLVIYTQGHRRGRWTDFAADTYGDMLDLIGAVMNLTEKRAAVAFAKQWLGIVDNWSPADAVRPSPAEMERRAAEARARAEAQQKAEAETRAAKIRGAVALYLRGGPSIKGTPAEYYLQGRGLSHAGLSDWPRVLRYSAEIWNREQQLKIPAMLAAVYLADGTHIATHRTYLQNCPQRGWTKIDSANAKMVLGPSWGGFIPINKGASGKSMRAMPEGEPVYMAEGIEDCLVIRALKPEARIIAGINLGNMGAIVLPAQARNLIIVADRDDMQAEVDKLERVIAQQQARGLNVSIVMPPKGVKDMNDWLKAQKGMAA